ncbi:MAG: phosphomannomutase/phosphoglucomutase [Mariprofundales bacterium]
MNKFPADIFREYDIRGIADTHLTDELAIALGYAYAKTLPAGDAPVSIGRDARLSGERLTKSVAHGVTLAGRNVIDLGMVATPQAYLSVFTWHAAGCIMVTGSHNPSDYNGFKMMRGKGSLHGEEIQKLLAFMEASTLPTEASGIIEQRDINAEYSDLIRNDIKLERALKVVIDAGNGPAGVVAAPLYRALGCEVIELFCDPDGTFPNHHPDPTVEANMVDIRASVLENKADIGIAFDGDGDRIGVVDEQGNIIWGDMLLLLLSRHLLQSNPGATIISEVKCSQHMYDDIASHGGNGIMWRTGHSPIKAKMKETGALLAGEMSGHIFFADRYFGFDDATYAGARVLEMLSEQKAPLSTLLDDVPHSVTTPEIRVECPDARKFDLVEEAKAHFASENYNIIDVDGMRIVFADGWGLLRASNTQPALVLRFEAPNAERLQTMRSLIEGWLENNR